MSDPLQSANEEPPVKPIRNPSSNKERQRGLSIGHSLNSNANFYDIPVSDVFNDLIERYIPAQDRPQRDVVSSDKAMKGLETMVTNNMWRSIAKYARQQIVQSDPNQIKEILKLWHLRLLALNKLGLCQLASAELEKLGNLDRPEFFDAEKEESLVPFELRILHAILPSYLKYPALTLERLSLLAIYCQKLSSRAKADSQVIWKYRELQTYLVLATHWIHLKDYTAAASTMQYILTRNNEDDVDIISSLGRLYLHIGDLSSANKMFERVEEICKGKKEIVKEAIEMNKAFAFMSQGKWLQARDILQQLYNINHDNLLAINNLAVCEVYLGNLVKAIELLENLTLDNPTSAGTCETAIMNMCTLYELRHEDATEKKIQVMKQVARWAGDSFQPDCIKLQ